MYRLRGIGRAFMCAGSGTKVSREADQSGLSVIAVAFRGSKAHRCPEDVELPVKIRRERPGAPPQRSFCDRDNYDH